MDRNVTRPLPGFYLPGPIEEYCQMNVDDGQPDLSIFSDGQ